MATKKVIAQGKVQEQSQSFRHGQTAYPQRGANVRGYQNLAGAQLQILQLAILTYTANAVYTAQFEDADGSITLLDYTENGDVDQSGVSESFGAVFTEHPFVRRNFDVEIAAPNIRLNAREEGISARLLTSDAKSQASEVQSGSIPDFVPFGVVCMKNGTKNNELQGKLPEPLSTARQLVISHGETGDAQVILKVDGELKTFSGATAAALVASMNQAAPNGLPDGITASDAGADVTVVVDTAGDVFELVEVTGDAEVSTYTQGDRLADKIAGIVVYHDMSEEGQGVYPGKKADVQEDETVTLSIDGAEVDGALYVGTTGDERGVLFASRGAGRVYVDGKLTIDEFVNGFAFVTIH